MAKISEYTEIESIGSDAMFIAETEDGSYRVPQAKFVELIEANSTKDYDELDNKPQINSVELDGDTSLEDLGIQAELTDGSIGSNLLADGSVAQNKLYTGVVGTKTYQGGNATYEDGVLTITYSTDSEWRGGGFYIKLFKGVNTIVKAKIDENVEYTANWYTWVDTATPKSRPISTVDGSVTIKDGYMYFEIPASFEETYGSDMALINMLRNTTAGKTVLSDIRVYPHKAFDATYVAEALGVGGGVTVDTQMSDSSTNAVQNRVIKAYVDGHTADAYTKAQTDVLLGAKQNALTAGSGITIENDVISATGGGGGADDLNDLNDVNITSASNGQVLKYNSNTHKWENEDEATADLTNIPHLYNAYYLDQTGQGSTSTMKIVIEEADDSSFELEAGDCIVLLISSSATLQADTPRRVGLYANDETTRIVSSSDIVWNNVNEQYVAGHSYVLLYDGGISLISSNVHTIAQVNALIDAKINALGNAEQEEF